MKMSKVILLGVTAVLLATSCRSGDDARARMRRLEPKLLASEQVDSCLAELRTIDTASLSRPADRARYALLHAMALDKNYIDTTDLSVIAPAADYYLKWYRPSRSKKFYTWYYKARIEENARRYDAALDGYLHAEQYMGATNDVYRTRLYFGMERVYATTIAHKRAYDSAKHALYYSRQSGDEYNISVALADCAHLSSVLFDLEEARAYIDEYEGSNFSHPGRSIAIPKLLYYRSMDEPDSMRVALKAALPVISSYHDLLLIASVAVVLKEYKVADSLLCKYERVFPSGDELSSTFYATRYLVRKGTGDYEGAMRDLIKDRDILSNTYAHAIDMEITSLADKYHSMLRNRTVVLVSIFILFVLLSAFVVILVYRRRKEKVLRLHFFEINAEYNTLYRLISEGIGGSRQELDDVKNLRKAILRVGSFLGEFSDTNIKLAIKGMAKASDDKRALSMVALLGAIYCNALFRCLNSHGLDDFETGYCFLVLLGLSSGEIGDSLSRSNMRFISMCIRKKLHMDDSAEYLSSRIKALYDSMLQHN